MTFFRFVFVLIISLLLLSPIIKTKGIIVQKPIIAVVQDNSLSIVLNKDSLYYREAYLKDLKLLINKLSEKYEVKFLSFSENTYSDTSINYFGNQTDISSVFPEVISRFAGMNLGALVLASDGVYNKGSNPIYTRNLKFPVYTIALGDTVSQKDLIVKDILHNKLAFYGNKFPVKLIVDAKKCIESNAELTIYRNKKVVYAETIKLPEENNVGTIDIELPADLLGVQMYDFKLQYLDNEISYENNHASIVVNVIDNRNKILILSSGPHPDIGALNFALKDNPDFETKIEYVNNFNGSISDYDVVVLNQLPSKKNNITSIISEIDKNKTSVLFIMGNNTSLPALNNLDKGLIVKSLSGNSDDAKPIFNKNFSAFGVDINEMTFMKFSSLKVIFGDYSITSDAKVLLYQEINGVKTEKPLIMFSEQEGVKAGFIVGEGIWRWRIDDYKNNSGHDSFKLIINRIFQYLIVKKLQNKLIVESKQVFSENENVIFTAEFYNEAFELVSNLDLEMILKDSDGKEYSYVFGEADNSYRLDLGRLTVGSYDYNVKTEFDGKSFTFNGKIIVKDINVEALNTKMSEITGGRMVYPSEMFDLINEIDNNPNITNIAYEREKLYTITDLYFLFFVILLFAVVEWSLRKYWGGY